LARPSPFITVCLAVGVLALGAEVTAIYRSHHRAPAAASETAPEEIEPAAPPPPIPPPAPTAPPPPPPPATVAVAPPPEPEPAAPVDAAAAQRPQFVSLDIETTIRTADEQVFAKLELPDATRAAIRRINEEHQQKLRLLRAGDAGVTGEQQLEGNRANVTAFRQTRREALQEILGPDTEIRFERAERAATKHLHNQLRAEALGGVSPTPSLQH
jgi:hypothetical protein